MPKHPLTESQERTVECLEGVKIRVRQSVGHHPANAIGRFDQPNTFAQFGRSQCRGDSGGSRTVDDHVG